MRDPIEGLTNDGVIRTGAHRDHIPDRYSAVLNEAVTQIHSVTADASIHVYGSVATGAAHTPDSDVDLLAIGLPADLAGEISGQLSAGFVHVCRGVEIAVATDADLRGARGFNGDIARHAMRWRSELERSDPAQLARRVARKTLLAVTGLVSVHDTTWTTDRDTAARRWKHIHPELAHGLDDLVSWSTGHKAATHAQLTHCLNTTVDTIVQQFASSIGLWPDS